MKEPAAHRSGRTAAADMISSPGQSGLEAGIDSPAVRSAEPIVRHLSQYELSERWNVSPRTLESWRRIGRGPAFIRAGRRIAYTVADVEMFERDNHHDPIGKPSEGSGR